MIGPEHYGLVEMAFTGVVVLGFAFWQLWTVRDAGRKQIRKDSGSTETAGHPER